MKFRPLRVGDLIQKELSEIIQREFEFDDALLTITSVEIDKKMERALVNVSVIPSSKLEEVVKKLEKAQGFLYHLLFKKLNIKPMPHLMFRPDRGFENAAIIEKQLMSVNPVRSSRGALNPVLAKTNYRHSSPRPAAGSSASNGVKLKRGKRT